MRDGGKARNLRAYIDIWRRKRERSMEALALYEPLPGQVSFHQSQAQIRCLLGSNQAGKSQAAAAEFVWAITGTHPFAKWPKENALHYAVGYDHKHIGSLMWPKMAREGAFWIIKDPETKRWRGWRPWQEWDREYKEKRRPAPPLLAPRLIQSISYLKKKDDIPASVRLKNGTLIVFYSSKGAPQQGTQIDGWWFDEELEREKWLDEIAARSMLRSARGFWSATPLASTAQLYSLHQRATSPESDGSVQEFTILLDDNPFISAREKKRFKDSLPADVLRVRYYGEFALTGRVVYPQFSRSIHCIPTFPVPETWTRFMVVDPGVKVCAVLFAAVPPDESAVHIYRELYLRDCSAKIFAERVAREMGEYKTAFEAFIIDNQMGRQTDVGAGRTVVAQYSEALALKGIECRATGSDFVAGCPDIAGRESEFRAWLEFSPRTGKPSVVIHNNCSMLCWEMDQQFYHVKNGVVQDRKRVDRDNHLVSCAEYLAAFQPRWALPPKPDERETPIERYLRDKRQRARARNEEYDFISLS